MGDSLVVVLLNAEGDKVSSPLDRASPCTNRFDGTDISLDLEYYFFHQFNASYLAGGVKGGKLAAEHITALVKAKTLGTKMVVYLVS